MSDLMFHIQLDFMVKGFLAQFPDSGGIVSIFSMNPAAPHLHICRNKAIMKQNVPVLVARCHGDEERQAQLGSRFYNEAPGWFPMFQIYTVPTRTGKHACLYLPFLFDRAPKDGADFLLKVIQVCRKLDQERALSAWYFLSGIGMNIQTPDGRMHRPEDYPDIFKSSDSADT